MGKFTGCAAVFGVHAYGSIPSRKSRVKLLIVDLESDVAYGSIPTTKSKLNKSSFVGNIPDVVGNAVLVVLVQA